MYRKSLAKDKNTTVARPTQREECSAKSQSQDCIVAERPAKKLLTGVFRQGRTAAAYQAGGEEKGKHEQYSRGGGKGASKQKEHRFAESLGKMNRSEWSGGGNGAASSSKKKKER